MDRKDRASVWFTLAVLCAALLGVGAVAAYADGHCASADGGDNRHPSGKDRSCESGSSGTQGSSESDPDGASNGGADKPGGSGGIDKADQDGNNGCGNDDDFEDDNRGNCLGRQGEDEENGALGASGVRAGNGEDNRGKKAEKAGRSDVLGSNAHKHVNVGGFGDDEALGETDVLGAGGVAGSNQVKPKGTQVLGSRFERGVETEVLGAGAVALPATGIAGFAMGLTAVIMILVGWGATKLAARRS